MTAASRYQFQRAMPVLECADLLRSVGFYRDRLGFSASTWGEPPTFAIVQRGVVTLALNQVPAPPAVSRRTWAAYLYVDDVDGLYAELSQLGVGIPEPPETRIYGCREFVADDPDGHIIAFGHVISPDPLGPGLSGRTGRDGQGRSA